MLNPQRPTDLHLLRTHADGELLGSELERAQSALEGQDDAAATARAVVEAERQLRKAVGRVLGEPVAPESLRSQIMLTLSEAPDIAGRIRPAHDQSQGVPQRAASRASLAWIFSSPQRANIAAVAAVLALIVGAVLFGIYGRTIDDVPTPPAADVVGTVALYADGEHTQCITSKGRLEGAIIWRDPAMVNLQLSELLGEPFTPFDLSAVGYTFIGAGPGAAPLDKQPSARLAYRKSEDGQSGALVSLFVAPLRGCCKSMCAGMRSGEWRAAEVKSCSRKVVYSTDGRLVYFLVCCDERDLPDIGRAISMASSGRR